MSVQLSEMVRWLNTVIENSKIVIHGLTDVYGLGFARARHLCNSVGVHHHTLIGDLRPWHFEQFGKLISRNKWTIQEDLKKFEHDNIVALQSIRHIRGIRHALKLPTRGQNTKNNGKTPKRLRRKGNSMDLSFFADKNKGTKN